jgi:hypothetical protein
VEGQNDKTATMIGSKVDVVSGAASSKSIENGELLDANRGQAMTKGNYGAWAEAEPEASR